MRHLTQRGTLEIYLYFVCAAVAAWMTSVSYSNGRPPWFYWLLVAICGVGVIRIFTVAWREDRPPQR